MPLDFDPPLLNSANPWATTKEDLQQLYDCPYTGAITTRTCLTQGFEHDDSTHQYCFFDEASHNITHHSAQTSQQKTPSAPSSQGPISSLNTLGYSPLSLNDYISIIHSILTDAGRAAPRPGRPLKPIIFSVSGTPSEITTHYKIISTFHSALQKTPMTPPQFLMEINLSCPNIANKPPPAYSHSQLLEYFSALTSPSPPHLSESGILIGIKTPPYTYSTQFSTLISALLSTTAASPSQETTPQPTCPIAFITATNTLGSSLILSTPSPSPFPTATTTNQPTPALASPSTTGIGGLAGSALHPLALGNVATLRRLLDPHPSLRHISIIGTGGVSNAAGYARMRSVGAEAVGVGTALGVEGVGIFERIWGDVGGMEGGEKLSGEGERAQRETEKEEART